MTQAFTLWLKSANFHRQRNEAAALILCLLADNPHTTLQVVLEAIEPRTLTPQALEALTRACFQETSYLDRFYTVQPGRLKAAKRLVALLREADRQRLGAEWIEQTAEFATIVWRGRAGIASDAGAECCVTTA